MLSKERHLLFAHGLIRKGGCYCYLLDDSEFLGVSKTREPFGMFFTGNSFVVSDVHTTRIVGELYDVPDYTLHLLDLLLDHPNYCKRVKVKVSVADAEDTLAYLYFYQHSKPIPSTCKKIINGDSCSPLYNI